MAVTDSDKQIRKHLKFVRRKMILNLVKSYYGWFLWHILSHKRYVKNTAVLLFPDDDEETQLISLLYLDQMLEKNKYKDAVILTHNNRINNIAGTFSKRISKIIRFSKRRTGALMQYYRLCEFDKRFICVSLDEPEGRNGSAIVGLNGTTKEEVVVIGIYRLYPYLKKDMPEGVLAR